MTGRIGAMLSQYARVLAGVFLFACLIVPPAVHAQGDTLTVSNCNDSSTGSLRAAITTANATFFDNIIFSVDCPSGAGKQITLTSTLTVSRAMTIDGSGHTVVIDGGGAVPVFTMPLFETVTLNNLTIQHGSATASGTTCADSPGTCGGGIFNGAKLSVTNSTVSGNSATGTGGGIYNQGTLNVTNSTLSGNSAANGGGIWNNGGAVTVTNSTVSSNSATGINSGGGGINNLSGTVTVTASTFSGNTATANGGAGGGILSSSGTSNLGNTVAVTNSTFSGNAAGRGGVIAADDFNTVTVKNSTLSGNSGHSGGGIFIFSGGTVSLTNTLLAANTATVLGANCENTSGGTLTDGGHNLEFNPTNTCGYSAANHDVLADPHLSALGTYGGQTQTFALLPGSPAIDAGDDATCNTTIGTAPVNKLDQRDISRPQGVHCDIGAFESQGFSLVKTSGDSQSTAVSTAFATPLSVTVASAHGEPVAGGQVTFTAPVGGAAATFTSNPAMIGGSGAASVTATANGTAGSYSVTASAVGAPSATFTLTNTPPGVSGISPASGSTAGGNRVTLTGAGFGTSATTQILLDGVALPATNVTSVTGTQIVYVAPAHAAGSVTVSVKVNGTALAASATYTYGMTTPLPVPNPPGGTGGTPNPLPSSHPAGPPSGTIPNPLPVPRP
jgi:hypothetical protein